MSYHAPVRLKDIQRVFEMQWLVIIDTTSTSYISNKVTWIKQKNQFQQDSGLFLVIFSYIRTLSSRNFSRWCGNAIEGGGEEGETRKNWVCEDLSKWSNDLAFVMSDFWGLLNQKMNYSWSLTLEFSWFQNITVWQ